MQTKKEADDGSVQKTIHSHHIDGVVWDAMLAAARPKLKLRRMSPIINVLRGKIP